LLAEHFYDIERLDPEDPNARGFQRVLNKGRAKKLADYLIDGQQDGDAFLPTSIFLATDKAVEFDEATNTLSFDVATVGPFSVVDGQHRLEGLKMAADRCPELLDFELAVNIAATLPNISQMCHFLIVNTTQKSVDKSVEQRILARLTAAVDADDVPNLPKWIKRVVESGDDEQALRIADYLNNTKESPWYQKIQMANRESKTATITQKTFVKAIKQFVLTANNPLSTYPTERRQRIMLNYWAAIARLLDTGKPTVLFKFGGSELFSRFSIPFFNKLAVWSDFRTGTMEQCLSQTFGNLEGEFAGVGHPDWWLSGTGAAMNLNSAGLTKINSELSKALHRTQGVPNTMQI
jgi:DGQHR domain-containing protein